MTIRHGDFSLGVQGPSLTVLERVVVSDVPRWAKVVHWVDYARTVAMTSLVSSAIRSLWECGKNRRVGDGDMAHVRVFDIELIQRALTFNAPEGGSVTSMSEHLFDLRHPMYQDESVVAG